MGLKKGFIVGGYWMRISFVYDLHISVVVACMLSQSLIKLVFCV